MEDKLGAILGNPQMMEKIMSMAQSLGGSPPPPAPEPSPPPLDPGMLQALSGLMGSANIDAQQQSLLRALAPYISPRRIGKLENAMRAAKMAGIAAQALRMKGQMDHV